MIIRINYIIIQIHFQPLTYKRSEVGHANTSTLTITNVTLEDVGQYTCMAGNIVGYGLASAWLAVKQGMICHWVSGKNNKMNNFSAPAIKMLLYVIVAVKDLHIV